MTFSIDKTNTFLMLGTKDMPILTIKGEVVWPKLMKKFQLHRIVTKFGVPGVLMNVIKSCKFPLDRDTAVGLWVFQKILLYISSSNFH
jgi:hypothetical protein